MKSYKLPKFTFDKAPSPVIRKSLAKDPGYKGKDHWSTHERGTNIDT